MKSWAFRSGFLSTRTKLNASYPVQFQYYLPNFLYTVLPNVISSVRMGWGRNTLWQVLVV
ncbi:MAG: hypothetical protein COX07_01175 [Bacteroidetes bacterium CG23_combo_of_CG06-09_8_20_14_all_32_9]|nr:MAG: hypothetical protein COX07_01175 [Bacteroidetes bacterium CG23_combo_of_CG06-09_8_20_14_all_32_9]